MRRLTQEADGRSRCVKEEGVRKSRSGEFMGSEHRPPTETPQHKVFSGPGHDSHEAMLDLSVCVHIQDASDKSCLE